MANPLKKLKQVNADYKQLDVKDKPIITVFNKVDCFEEMPILKDLRADGTTFVSARTGQGIENLLQTIEQKIAESQVYVEMILPYKATGMLADIRTYGQLLEEDYREEGIFIRANVRKQDVARLEELQ